MQVVWLVVAIVFLAISGYYLVTLANKAIKLLETLNDKIVALEAEIMPILKEAQQTIRDIEPLAKELGEKSAEISRMIDNMEKISQHAEVTTGAVRDGVVPFAHALSGIIAGFTEGAGALKDIIRRG